MNKLAYFKMMGLNKIAVIPYQEALDQAGYDSKKLAPDEFIYGDDKHRWVVAPSTKRRYDINKLPDELQDTIYQHLHLANLLKAWREEKGIPFLTEKQNSQLVSMPEQDARYLHNRKKALQLVVDSYLSKNKAKKRPNIKSYLSSLVYHPGED